MRIILQACPTNRVNTCSVAKELKCLQSNLYNIKDVLNMLEDEDAMLNYIDLFAMDLTHAVLASNDAVIYESFFSMVSSLSIGLEGGLRKR